MGKTITRRETWRTPPGRARRTGGVVLAVVLVAAACSGGESGPARAGDDPTGMTAPRADDAPARTPAPCAVESTANPIEDRRHPNDRGAGPPELADGRARAEVAADADWIVTSQLPSGAIALGPERDAVWGYLANFAARGLARAADATGDAEYADAALRWFRWYQDHQEPDGSVHDHQVSRDGTETSTGFVDAVDASAGTYLWALEAWWETTGDRRALDELEPSVRLAVDAIVGLQDGDGLTWARTDWPVKYLMDQAETHAGLVAGVELAETLGLDELAAEAERAQHRLQSGVEARWDDAAGGYIWAVHSDGTEDPPTWSHLPDALQQIWAVAFGLACPHRQEVVVERFLSHHPDWSDSPSVGWWAPVTWALDATSRGAQADAGLRALTQASTATGRSWPFTPADAGQLLEARARP